jgi:hypothetical protein
MPVNAQDKFDALIRKHRQDPNAHLRYLPIEEFLSVMAMHTKDISPGGRLTLTTGVPVTSADVIGATSVYYTPYVSDLIALWDGTKWVLTEFADYPLALGTLISGRNYDAFAYSDGLGAFAMESLAWTNDTTRATAITIQDGRYCKSGDKTRIYLGTFRTTSTTTTEDSLKNGASAGGKRFVWNMYNRVKRAFSVIDNSVSWSYSTAAWRQARANAGNMVEFVIGLSEDAIAASVFALVDTTGPKVAVGAGIGLDRTNGQDGKGPLVTVENLTGQLNAAVGAEYVGQPSAGYHFLAWVEYGAGAGTQTWFGNAIHPIASVGIHAEMMA